MTITNETNYKATIASIIDSAEGSADDVTDRLITEGVIAAPIPRGYAIGMTVHDGVAKVTIDMNTVSTDDINSLYTTLVGMKLSGPDEYIQSRINS